MKNNTTPRVLIAAAQSGAGKTTITMAILKALSSNGKKLASFKCGPDYIDTMFHARAVGEKSSNLDGYFMQENVINHLLKANSIGCDISVIEGVMGFYDGISFNSLKSSSYDISNITKTPVILIVSCKGMAASVLPIIKGFLDFQEDNLIKAVILNNISQGTYKSLKLIIEEYFTGRIQVVGFLPPLEERLVLKSRHLGLITANEIEDLDKKIFEIAEIAKNTIDLQAILDIGNTASNIEPTQLDIKKNQSVNIGVAYDKAFCFYYKDNLRLLEMMGANLVYFSPIEDKELPKNLDGLYIGGGYPEIYLQQLFLNNVMRYDIKKAIDDNIPLIAECGGFMYLTQKIDGVDMVGAFPGECFNTKKLSRFGYVTLTAMEDNLLLSKNEQLKAHEFHYYDSSDNSNGFKIEKASGKSWNGVFSNKRQYAGFPHIHFYQNINLAQRFYDACVERKNNG